jgi:hypothetical protein
LKLGSAPVVTRVVQRFTPEMLANLPPAATPMIEELQTLAEKGRRGRMRAADQKRVLELLREIHVLEREANTPRAEPAAPSKRGDSFTSVWDDEPSIWDDEPKPRA